MESVVNNSATDATWRAGGNDSGLWSVLPGSLSNDSNVAEAGCIKLPFALVIAANIYMCVNILFTWLANLSLITVISTSPNLRTAPNNHLINICVNNLFLSICMVLSMITINSRDYEENTHTLLASIQLFIVTNSFLQYWNCFTSIGYYRLRTIKKPSLGGRVRREIIHKCITASWSVSTLLSLVFTLANVDSTDDAHQTLATLRDRMPEATGPSSPQIKVVVMSLVILMAFLVNLVLIFSFYYRVFRMFNQTGPVGKNRVNPLMIVSESTDLVLPAGKLYKPMENNWVKPYTVSEDFIVHYQKGSPALDFDNAFALENPVVVTSIQNRFQTGNLRQVPTNVSLAPLMCKGRGEFSDISPNADTQWINTLRSNSALRNQLLKRDRVSLSGAMRNSLVMVVAFLLCSMPMFFCIIPGILSSLSAYSRMLTLSLTRLLFYLNAPFYPAWYLFFSKRVRKCLTRFTERFFNRCHIRR